MVTLIEIDGFKTFSKFQMEFAPLTIIAGTNASGKSNLFDAMQLLSRIVEVDLKTAFSSSVLFSSLKFEFISEKLNQG
ncbi:MAG: DUF2813 domain-containing protein [Sphingobacteriaceae bacterium]|nr:MAG: DUF2813 domain-containing protein [Sphingobacteriaceae bacterium]